MKKLPVKIEENPIQTKKSFFGIKYPKLLLLIASFAVAYLFFVGGHLTPLNKFIYSLGYLGILISGILFTYGFTAAPATALLLLMSQQQNLLLSGFIGGFGALIGDLLIFNLIRTSFLDEIGMVSNWKVFFFLRKRTPLFIKKYVIPVLACFIIASPLPDEIGVSLLASSTRISQKWFSVLSYSLNTLGIFAVLLAGKAL